MTDHDALFAMVAESYDLAAFLKAFDIGKTTYFDEVKSGRLRSHKEKGKIVINRDDAINWLKCLIADMLPKQPAEYPVQFWVYVSQRTADSIRQMMSDTGASSSEVLREAINFWLESKT